MFRTSAIFVPLDVVTICWLRYFKSTLLRYKKLRWYSVHRLYPTSLHYFVVGVVTFVTRYEKLWLRYSLLTPYVHVQTWLFLFVCWCSWFVSIFSTSSISNFATLFRCWCSDIRYTVWETMVAVLAVNSIRARANLVLSFCLLVFLVCVDTLFFVDPRLLYSGAWCMLYVCTLSGAYWRPC